jgi:hypothetical protein
VFLRTIARFHPNNFDGSRDTTPLRATRRHAGPAAVPACRTPV